MTSGLLPLALALLAGACAEPPVARGRSLLSDLEALGTEDSERSDSAPRPGLAGWPAGDPDPRGPAPLDGSEPVDPTARLGSLRLGNTARAVLWLTPDAPLRLPLPRGPVPTRLNLEIGRATGTSAARVRASLEPRNGTPEPPTALDLPAAGDASDRTWRGLSIDLEPRLRPRLDVLRLELESVDERASVGVGLLRLTPVREVPAGTDLLLICDERAADGGDDRSSAKPDVGLRLDDCWAQSPDPDLALASLLGGHAPTVHRALEDGVARTRILGVPGQAQSLGSWLRSAGYRTLAYVDADAVGAARPLDLGFDLQRVVAPGQALRTAATALSTENDAARAVLVVRGPGAPPPDLRALSAASRRVVVHTTFPSAEASGASADPATDGPDRPAFDADAVQVSLTLVAPGLEAALSSRPTMHLDLLPTLASLLEREPPLGLEGAPIVERAGVGRWRVRAFEPNRLLWAELPGRTYLARVGSRRTAWVPPTAAQPEGLEFSVELRDGRAVTLESAPQRVDAIRARLAALDAYRRALYGAEED